MVMSELKDDGGEIPHHIKIVDIFFLLSFLASNTSGFHFSFNAVRSIAFVFKTVPRST
jgi:hypothetical protein